MATKNPTPLLYQLREGSVSDPFVDKVENVKLVAGRAILDEIPVKQFGIIVDGHQETGTNNPTGVQFYVDYTNGVLYFEPTKTGSVTVRYKGRGVVQIPSDRIFHPDAETNETLDLTFKRLEAKVKDAETKGNVAESQGNTASTQATHAKTQGDYAKSQGDYAKAQGDLAKGVVAGVIPNATQSASGLMSAGDKTALDNGQKWKLTRDNGRSEQRANVNLDNEKLNSFFYVGADAINRPEGAVTGWVQVEATSDLYVVQTFRSTYISPTSPSSLYQRVLHSNGIWQPWRKITDENSLTNTLMGNKITVQSNANFIGKIQDSTTINPHSARRLPGSTLLVPSSFTLDMPQAELNKIVSLDSQTTSLPNSGSGVMPQHLFSFNLIEHVQRTYGTIPGATTADKVAWLRTNVNKLTFNWWGFGSSPVGFRAMVKRWSQRDNTYYASVTHTSGSVTKLTNEIPPGSMDAFIDNSGSVHFNAHTDPSDGTTPSIINTDYVELQVELSTDIKTNLLLGGVQGHKLTADNGYLLTIPSNDPNSLSVTGVYKVSDGIINTPKQYGTLLHQQLDVSIWTQVFIEANSKSNQMYFRNKTPGGITSWKRTSTDVDAISYLMGNSVTDQSNANFIGKVSGSTTANPHIAKVSGSFTTNPNPATFSAEMSQSSYDRLSSADNNLMLQSANGLGYMGQHLFSFNLIVHIERTYGTIPGMSTADKVSWLKTNISKLSANWYGYGSSPTGNKANFAIWSATSLAWGSNPIAHTHSGSTSSKITLTGSYIGGMSSQIDSNGFVHFLAYAEPSDGTTASVINTDYVELIVDLDTSLKKNLAPTWIDAVLQNGWVEFDNERKPKYSLGADGYVTMRGAVKSGTLPGTITTLPSGMRSNNTQYYVVTGNANDSYRITVGNGGTIYANQLSGTGGSSMISLDGIRFPTN